MKTKPFDCVEMKGRIQQEMAEEEARCGSDEMKRRRDEWLETGSDPLARWWRSHPSSFLFDWALITDGLKRLYFW